MSEETERKEATEDSSEEVETADGTPDGKTASAEETKDSEEEGIVEESKLPLPRATVVNLMRRHLDSGKQIKGAVKDEMNMWLGRMVERVTQKMNEHPYTYIDYGMFKEAIEPYEKIQDVEIEKEHIIKRLEAVKSDCDVLIREVDRKFTL
jgi:histone H3/H4